MVAKAFSLAGALYKAGDVHDIKGGGNSPLRLADVRKNLQPLPMLVAKFSHPLYCILECVLINIVGM